MSQPLFENLSEISRRISAAPHILLFLDFDGTLTPIVERPSMAHLSPETKDILIRLSRHDNISLAIISGRALVDIQERVGIENLIYAGNHGMEISGSEFHFIHPKAAARQEALQHLSEHLAMKLRHIAGVKVEQKGLTTSIHYRRVSAACVDEVVQTVQDVANNASYLFRLTRGKMVCEIRPRVDWHKGAAVSWISDRLGHTKALAIYFGDDTTDEDAFAALSQGITVQVGPSIITSAHYHLADPSEVQKFLHWLAHAIDQGSHHATKKTNTKPNVSGEK